MSRQSYQYPRPDLLHFWSVRFLGWFQGGPGPAVSGRLNVELAVRLSTSDVACRRKYTSHMLEAPPKALLLVAQLTPSGAQTRNDCNASSLTNRIYL